MPTITNQEAALIAKEIGSVVSKMLSNHQSFLKEMNDDRGKRRGTKGNSDSSKMNINRRLTMSINNLTKNVDKSAGIFEQLNKHLNTSTKRTQADSEVQKRTNRRVHKDQLRYTKYIAHQAKGAKHLADTMANTNEKIKDGGDGAKNNLDSFGDALKKYGSMITSRLGIGVGIKTIFNDLQAAASRSNIYNESTQIDSLMMGTTVKELIDLQSIYRRDALRASGGIQEWTDSLRGSQMDLLAYTGSLLEANKANAAIRSSVMDVGLSFNEATDVIGSGQNGLVGQLKQLSSATGKTIIELNEGMRSIVSGDETRFMLQKMDKTQRGAYLLDQATARTRYTLLTGSLEKADELLKSQQNESRKGYKERFIEAAKLQSAAARSGMDGGDAKRLSELTRKNPALRSEIERLELLQLRGSLANTYSQLAGSGDARTEMSANVIMDQLGINALNDQNLSTYNGLDANATEQHQQNNLSSIVDGNDTLKESLLWQQRISKTLDNGFIQMIGGFGLLLAKGTKFNPLNWFKKNGAGGAGAKLPMFGKGGQIRNAEAAAHKLGRNSKMMSSLGYGKAGAKLGKGVMTGGLIGAGTAVAGIAIDQLYDAESSNEATGKNALTSALAGAGYGAMLGSVVPVIGTAVGAAVGGVIGGIVGLLEDVKSDRQFNAEAEQEQLTAEMAVYDAEMKNLGKRQQFELDGMSDIFEQQKLAVESQDYARVKMLQTEIDNVKERHTAEMDVITQQKAAAAELSSVYNKLAKSENDYSKFTSAFSDADELDWLGKHQIDTGELLDQSGMSAQNILAKVLEHASGLNISKDEKAEISKALSTGAELEGARFHEIFKTTSAGIRRDYEKTQTRLDSEVNTSTTGLDRANKEFNTYTKSAIVSTPTSDLSPMVEKLNLPKNESVKKEILKDTQLTKNERTTADSNNDGIVTDNEKLTYIATILEKTLNANERNHTITQEQAEQALRLNRKNKKSEMVTK